MSTLDERMDALLGDDPTDDCLVLLELSEPTARVVIEGLRCALYGGSQPPHGRRSLLLLLDAIQASLALPCTDKSRGFHHGALQAAEETI